MNSSAPASRDDGALVHAALLYRHPDQLRIALREFLADAAAAGEPVLAIMPGFQLDLLDDVLQNGGPGVQAQDMTQAGRNPARLIPLLLDWVADADGPSRVVSEAMWPQRSYAEAAECLRHEALLNHALADAPLSVLCPFDIEHLGPDVIAGAELTHPRLIDEAGLRPSMVYGDPLDVARGESWPQVEPDTPVFELAFDGDLWALRHALSADPLLEELDPERRENLVFAVNEAATNAVRHGDGHARARFWRDAHHVVGEVSTTTSIEDPLVGRRTPVPGALGGRGLWLINQVCDLVEVRSAPGGASVRMRVAAA
jgi:anti-sigma regulatory factor (Ser/Thr protein kinase)